MFSTSRNGLWIFAQIMKFFASVILPLYEITFKDVVDFERLTLYGSTDRFWIDFDKNSAWDSRRDCGWLSWYVDGLYKNHERPNASIGSYKDEYKMGMTRSCVDHRFFFLHQVILTFVENWPLIPARKVDQVLIYRLRHRH